jgi:hypothetical protein
MAENTLTNLAGDIYVAADVVSRELVGMIPASTINGGAERAALNDTVRSFVAPSAALVVNTPAMTIPEGTGQVVGNETMTLDKTYGVPIPWTGEGMKHVNNGSGYETILGAQIAQAMRALTNQMETDLAVAARAAASRAWGTATTTPFGTANDYTDGSNVLRILKENGAGGLDNQMVLNTLAGANFLGKQSAVNAAGTDSMLRQGVLLDLAGMPIRESAALGSHTAGAGTAYTSAATGFAIGTTSIPIITGSGTVLAGDIVKFAGDTNGYVVKTGVAAPGTIVIQAPGLRRALAASAVAMTITATSTDSLAFSRSAVELAVRAPAMPGGGDAAVDNMLVTDPRSGISFDVSLYKGFQKSMLNVSAVWGVKAWKPEHIALLIG